MLCVNIGRNQYLLGYKLSLLIIGDWIFFLIYKINSRYKVFRYIFLWQKVYLFKTMKISEQANSSYHFYPPLRYYKSLSDE